MIDCNTSYGNMAWKTFLHMGMWLLWSGRDIWRHFAPKGRRSIPWEFMNWIILRWVVLALILFFVLPAFGMQIIKSYTSVVDFWLIAVIPVAAYPFFVGKIWCRYWRPLAKYIQIFSK